MVKKTLTILLTILVIILAYILQIYVINNITLFGMTGDLVLMSVVLITLMKSNSTAYIVAVICGVTSDILFSDAMCKYLVIYVIVVSVLIGLKKMYKQDSKLAIIIFSGVGILISETLLYLYNIVSTGQFVNIFIFGINIVKQCIINICLTFILYLLFKLISKKEEQKR